MCDSRDDRQLRKQIRKAVGGGQGLEREGQVRRVASGADDLKLWFAETDDPLGTVDAEMGEGELAFIESCQRPLESEGFTVADTRQRQHSRIPAQLCLVSSETDPCCRQIDTDMRFHQLRRQRIVSVELDARCHRLRSQGAPSPHWR